jgi:3',5'-cyclic AMP phosphodiesterase CpdA
VARIVHLSDLHFGRARPELVAPLVATVTMLRPDLVAVSGDLTQRARSVQFRQAAALFTAMPCPVLSVPGNHDVPLWNVLVRLSHPYYRYQALVRNELEPTATVPGVTVLGVNSVDPLAWQRGRLSSRRIRRTVERIEMAEGLRVIVLHHPFLHPPGADKEPMEGADAGFHAFARAGADLVLSGHLHLWSNHASRPAPDAPAMIHAQAGTGLSTRLRGEENDFNLIDTGDGRVTITRYYARDDGLAFETRPPRHFRKGGSGWSEVEDQPFATLASASSRRSQSASSV